MSWNLRLIRLSSVKNCVASTRLIVPHKCVCVCVSHRHSAAEHRASTRILHLTLFLASVFISVQVFLILLAFSSTVLRHVFLGLPLPRFPWWYSRTCLAISLDGLCTMAQPSPLVFPYLQIYSIASCISTTLHSLSGPARKFSIFS